MHGAVPFMDMTMVDRLQGPSSTYPLGIGRDSITLAVGFAAMSWAIIAEAAAELPGRYCRRTYRAGAHAIGSTWRARRATWETTSSNRSAGCGGALYMAN